MSLSNCDPSQDAPLYLSDLLRQGRIGDVEILSRVVIHGLDIRSYSGYITVNERFNSNLFFWFFPATEVPPEEAALLVYLNGGPGNSSMIGLFEEVGPLKVNEDGTVGKRQLTWTDKFSVIFIDSPVGVGFSYCCPGGEATTNKDVAENLCSFLVQFLQLFPVYQKCDVYLGGISYAGTYVPVFAYKIHTDVCLTSLRDQLKGIFICSGLCDPGKMLPYYPDLLVSLGLLTEKAGREITEEIKQAVNKHGYFGRHKEAVMDIKKIVFSDMTQRLGYSEMDNALFTKKSNWMFPAFLNQPEIQRAIHVKPTEYKNSTGKTIVELAEDFFSGAGKELSEIMDNYKVLMLTGQMDMLVSVKMTEVLLQDLPWSGRDEYLVAEKHKWMGEDGDVAGYFSTVNTFTRVVMRNAGHRPAVDQPAWTKDLMYKFVHNISLDQRFDVQVCSQHQPGPKI